MYQQELLTMQETYVLLVEWHQEWISHTKTSNYSHYRIQTAENGTIQEHLPQFRFNQKHRQVLTCKKQYSYLHSPLKNNQKAFINNQTKVEELNKMGIMMIMITQQCQIFIRLKPQSLSNIPQHFEPTKSLTEGFQKPKGTARDICEFVHAYVCIQTLYQREQ